MSELQPVVFLLGPTACGKTSCSIKLAKILNAEIVSVDSALVYKGMNIGTAKPDMAERAGIAHHLIDVCTPDDAYSVARFCKDALAVINDVHSRGKQAVLAGGTMLYFNALEHGIAPLPDASPEVRKALSDEAGRVGWPTMHKRLELVDSIAAARIHPNDPQRLQRALEVHEITGVALSELQKNTKSMLSVPPIKFALVPDDRTWLHKRIGKRFGQMLNDGFLDEVSALRRTYDLHAELPSMRSVGYRQALAHLDGADNLELMTSKAEAATRQLAKRQITWIRSMDNLHAISCDKLDVQSQVDQIMSILREHGIQSVTTDS